MDTTRHPTLYIPDGDLVIQVENTLFRIHKWFLKKFSPVFQDMLQLSQPGGVQGGSDDHPAQVAGDTAKDWENFLEIFYPDNPMQIPYRNYEKWSSILRISHKYDMKVIEESGFKAVMCFNNLDAIELMVLSREVDSSMLFKKAESALRTRNDPLTLLECKRIGIDDYWAISVQREEYMRSQNEKPVESDDWWTSARASPVKRFK